MKNTVRKATARKNDKGFTLIEIIVTVVLIGILAGIGIPNLIQFLNWSKVNAVVANSEIALKAYNVSLAQAGVGTNVHQGNGGATMSKYIEIGDALAVKLSNDEYTVGLTAIPDADGNISTCAYSIADNGKLGRTVGPAACNQAGPHMGLSDVD